MAEPYQYGHRERARERFLKRDPSFFENYELFELLLFYSIPRKDTKGIAKSALAAFPDMKSMLSADEEALVTVEGIGKRSASLIKSAARVVDFCLAEEKISEPAALSVPDYHSCGNFIVDYYRGRRENLILMISLDNAMNVLGVDEVYKLNFSSGGVKASDFIRIAVRRCASVAVVAFNHPTGPLFPLPSEMETCKMLNSTFADAGIFLAEQYLISGNAYLGTMQHLDLAFGQRNPQVENFLKSKTGFGFTEVSSFRSSALCEELEKKIDALSELLGFAVKDGARPIAERLVSHFGGIRGIFEADPVMLASLISDENAGFVIKLLGEIISRRLTESLRVGRKCTNADLQSFACGLFFGKSYEETHILCFDGENKYLGEGRVAEGTVNTTEVTPRRIIDLAFSLGACRVVLVHNHPRGQAEPSDSDIESTDRLSVILATMGISVIAHYIVANGKAENFIKSHNI